PDEVVAGRAYPLIIYLHGSGQGHAGDGAVFDRWAGPSRCFVAQACARRCDFYKSFAMRDVRDVIADVTSRFAIDPDRISLYGYSAGAFATLRMASQTPHEFAAIASLAGDLPPGEEDNLSAVPTLVVHGLSDPNVPIASGMAMNLFEWRRTGAPVTERLLPRSGHGTPLSGVEDWLLRHVRNPAPSAVVCRTARHDPRPGRAHWVAITSLVITDQQAAVSARIDGSVLKAVTANAAGCAFALASLPGRIEAIEIDGQRLTAPTAACVALTHGANGWTAAGCERMPEPDPADYAPGGVENLFRAGPILIVSGEGFGDAAQRLASFSPDGANATIHWPVKAAAEVVPADLAANNLILLGGADVNAVSAAVAKATWLLPLPANEAAPPHALQAERTYLVPMLGEGEPTAIAGVTAFAAENYAFSLVTRNPFAPARRVWLLIAPDEKLIARRSNLLRTWWQEGTPDLFVVERATGMIVAEWTMGNGWRPGMIWR
ncbi:MAG: prolyl oligopeptidase family serine peptidase, partial [Planctomycetes bacterium]|nr:prolyl oligopeptidase family serine peptidase [Planctomycetota bacterium]